MPIQYFPSICVLIKKVLNHKTWLYETSLSISPSPSLANPRCHWPQARSRTRRPSLILRNTIKTKFYINFALMNCGTFHAIFISFVNVTRLTIYIHCQRTIYNCMDKTIRPIPKIGSSGHFPPIGHTAKRTHNRKRSMGNPKLLRPQRACQAPPLFRLYQEHW